MQFDTKIGIQQIIALVTALFGIAAAYFTLKTDISLQAQQIERLEIVIKELQASRADTNTVIYELKRDMAIVRFQVESRAIRKPE